MIWSPALIMCDVSYTKIGQLIDWAVKINWYFDIVSRDHITSLPIRIINLLRIHDHLHELQRYDSELTTLQGRIDEIEQKLQEKGS
jgi:hypothetical protein